MVICKIQERTNLFFVQKKKEKKRRKIQKGQRFMWALSVRLKATTVCCFLLQTSLEKIGKGYHNFLVYIC